MKKTVILLGITTALLAAGCEDDAPFIKKSPLIKEQPLDSLQNHKKVDI